MKARIKSFLERRRQLIESMSAPIVLTLVILLVFASSIDASTTNQQQQQQQQQQQTASAITNLIGQPAPKSLALQSSQLELGDNAAAPAEGQPGTPVAAMGLQQAAEPAQTSSSGTGANSIQSPAGTSSVAPSGATPRLPKINIYASRNEVKKLLGIDTSINYVTNGQLNLYPLGFTIPMGYHLSDMIFTWQNLGPTNVNYSISLVIGNVHAVERPLINITRSGLIPRNEQVFKITLPCSGKITDDVDVQVLINITGQVPASADERDGSAEHADDAQTNSDLQMARAVHQQQNELMSSNLINQTGGDQMQADESALRRAAAMRQVSHVIAIKRKKICTMHPVPVTPAPRPAPVWPPNQPPAASNAADSAKFQPTPSNSILPPLPASSHNSANQQANSKPERPIGVSTAAPSPPQPPASRPISQWQQPVDQPTPEPPAHQPGWPAAPAPNAAARLDSPQAAGLPGRQPHLWPELRHPSSSPSSPASSSSQSPVNDPLIDLLHPRLAPGSGEYNSPGPAPGANALNPLLFTLILMALIISAALVALLVIGTASSPSALRRHPLDKLNALTNCLFRRTGGSRAQAKCTKAAHSSVISSSSLVVGPNLTIKQGGFGSMGGFGPHSRAHHATLGPAGASSKSAVSSLSGLSADSGLQVNLQQQQQQQHGKQQQPSGLYYYAKQQQQQQQHYSPYYHHYQCPPDLLIGANQNGYSASQTTSPYHITMSNQQTTKLFLGANGTTGFAVDNNYTITPPTTLGHNHHQQQQQQARSDSSSVYQTIY